MFFFETHCRFLCHRVTIHCVPKTEYSKLEENANENENALIFEHTLNFTPLGLVTYLLFQFPVPTKYSLQIADDFI